MRPVILAMFLCLLGCSGGESTDASDSETAKSAGDEIQQQYNDALDQAAGVEDLMQEQKEEIDEAVDDATD